MPDRSLLEVYSEWLAKNPQFSEADVRRANVLLHTNYQSLLNGNVSALSTARLGDAKSIPAVDQVRWAAGSSGLRVVVGCGSGQGRPPSSSARALKCSSAQVLKCALHPPPASHPTLPQMVTAGFPAVVDALTPRLDIQFGTRVTSVEQDAAGVTVTAADGASFAAHYALLTPSLGCLKAGNISFVPPLPEAKAAAIRAMVRWPALWPACLAGA